MASSLFGLGAPGRLYWATLLRRVYNIDALKCPRDGRLRFVALVEDRNEAQAELKARGLPADLDIPSNTRQSADHDHVDDEPTDDWDQRPEAPDTDPSAASRIWEDPQPTTHPSHPRARRRRRPRFRTFWIRSRGSNQLIPTLSNRV